MMTVDGLFGAGDAVGGTPHAFSSGSFTEGRLSAKAACKYIDDGKAEGINISQKQIDERKAEIYRPSTSVNAVSQALARYNLETLCHQRFHYDPLCKSLMAYKFQLYAHQFAFEKY
jgi:succinate dehydrogenase/fumarate reductase flavoprotein subunit